MSKKQREYERIPGRGRTLRAAYFHGERQRLYAAHDHLLVVRESRAEETYKKFYFDDIQAITLQSNPERLILSILYLAILLVLGGLAIAFGRAAETDGPLVYTVFGTIMALPFLSFIWNLVQGPTCTVKLHTAVQVEALTALRRIGRATRSLELISTHIDSAQGSWDGDSAIAELENKPTVRATSYLPRQLDRKGPRTISAFMHRIGFGAVFASGIAIFIDFVFIHDVKNIFDLIIFTISAFSLLIAAIRQLNSTIPVALKAWTWISLTTVCLVFVTFFVYQQIALDSFETNGLPDMLNPHAKPASQWPVAERVFYALYGLGNLVIAVIGFSLISRYRIVTTDPIDSGTAEVHTESE